MEDKKPEIYNVIEICGITVVSKTSNIREVMNVANELLSKHKEFIQKKQQENFGYHNKYIG